MQNVNRVELVTHAKNFKLKWLKQELNLGKDVSLYSTLLTSECLNDPSRLQIELLFTPFGLNVKQGVLRLYSTLLTFECLNGPSRLQIELLFTPFCLNVKQGVL